MQISDIKNIVITLLGALRPYATLWSPSATLGDVRAFESKWFSNLPEQTIELWTAVNGFYVRDLLVYGIPVTTITADGGTAQSRPHSEIIDVSSLFQYPYIEGCFTSRRLLPIAPDGFGNIYALDASAVQGDIVPVILLDHELQYSPIILVASNLWTFLRFLIGYEIGHIGREIGNQIPNGDELMGDDPEKWPSDRDYVTKLDPWIEDVHTDVAPLWEEE